MTRDSKVDKGQLAKAVSESTVRGSGPSRFAVLPHWAGPQLCSVAARSLLGEPAEFSHLALGYYPVYTPRN